LQLQNDDGNRAILIRMANATAALRSKIDLFLNGYKDWSAKRIARAIAEWHRELNKLSQKGSAASEEVVAAVKRVNSAASEPERNAAQLALDQAVIQAESFKQNLRSSGCHDSGAWNLHL